MNSRINFIEGRTIVEKIKNIDLSNVHHIMWIYKNLIDIYKSGSFHDILNLLTVVNVEDYSHGCTIYDDLCIIIFKIYNIKHEDIEIKYLTLSLENKICKVEDDNFNTEIEKSLFMLCTPIMDCCLKQVVDLFTYVYKINYNFENINKLIEKFNLRSDILIELLLLKMKLTRQIKKDENISELINKMNLKDDSNTKLKDLILEYESTNLNFFIENICIYLEFKNDDDFISKLIYYCQSGYKHLIIRNISIEIYDKLKNDLEMSDELLKKGVYDYNFFINWSRNCFNNLSVLKVNDFVEISRLFINYYRKEKNNRKDLIEILKKLIKLNINFVSEKIKMNILKYVDEIIEEDIIIEKFVVGVSEVSVYKNILVKKLKILKHFSVEDKNQIISNLFKEFDLNWRYRKTLIEECVKYSEILGFKNYNWLEHFKNDKVYFIREMCNKILNNNIEKSIKSESSKNENIYDQDLLKSLVVNNCSEDIKIKEEIKINEEIEKQSTKPVSGIIINTVLLDAYKEINNPSATYTEETFTNINKSNNEGIKNTAVNLQEEINETVPKINEEIFDSVSLKNYENSDKKNTQKIKYNNQIEKNEDICRIHENKNDISDTILDRKPLENIEVFKKDEIFDKLKNNVKNRIKSIEEKIVFVSEKKNEK